MSFVPKSALGEKNEIVLDLFLCTIAVILYVTSNKSSPFCQISSNVQDISFCT